MSRFSIIIPVYNAEKYLKDCIGSILKQSFSDVEIICVDDGSKDKSFDILEEFKKEDHRIRTLKQLHSDAGTARNIGLEAASGDYLMFLDADDFLSDNAFIKLDDMISKEKEPDILVFGANEFYTEHKDILRKVKYENLPNSKCISPKEIKDDLFISFRNWPWNKAYKRSFIEDNHIRFQSIPRSNDVMFVCLSLALAGKIVVLDETLVNHRLGHSDSLQATIQKDPSSFWDAFTATYRELKNRVSDFSLYERSFLNCTLLAIDYYLNSVKSDKEGYEFLKTYVIKNGEKDFSFLEHDPEYFFGREYYYRYQELLSSKDNKKHSNKTLKNGFENVSKLKGFYVSLSENGVKYTFKRVLFHLGLGEDNDPLRTFEKKKKEL